MELRLGVVGCWICASKNWVFDWMDVVFFDFLIFIFFIALRNIVMDKEGSLGWVLRT